MSISETLIGVNSAALDTPLNHMIWLQDYKTYGENSYVFQNKDILHELYKSSVAANDMQVCSEALDYLLSLDSCLGSFIGSVFFSDRANECLKTVDSVSDLVSAYYPLLWIFSESGELHSKFGSNVNLLNAVLSVDNLPDVVNEHVPDANAANLQEDVITVWLNKYYNVLSTDIDKIVDIYILGNAWRSCLQGSSEFLESLYSYCSSNMSIKTASVTSTWCDAKTTTVTPTESGKKIVVLKESFMNNTGLSVNSCLTIKYNSSFGSETISGVGTTYKTLRICDGIITMSLDRHTTAGGSATGGSRIGTIEYIEV